MRSGLGLGTSRTTVHRALAACLQILFSLCALTPNAYPGQQPRLMVAHVQSVALSPERVIPQVGDGEIATSQGSTIYRGGLLTIQAGGAQLIRLLQQLGNLDRMLIEGKPPATRVFGTFGPSSPHEVLTELLDGVGCNVMMVGLGYTGLPRQLIFTTRVPLAPIQTPAGSQVDAQETRLGSVSEPSEGFFEHVPPPPSIDPQERLQHTVQRLRALRERQMQRESPAKL